MRKNKVFAVLLSIIIFIAAFGVLSGFSPAIPQKKFYVNRAALGAISRMTTINTDNIGFYVYGNEYKSRKITYTFNSSTSNDDIDALIYTLRRLEKKISDNVSTNRNDIFNNSVGYIRSINKKYSSDSEEYLNRWKLVAGEFNNSVHKLAALRDLNGITVKEFFACFVEPSEYNTSYDAQDGKPLYDFILNQHILLDDPLDSAKSNNKIDLIHLFASMDGIFEETGRSGMCNIMLGKNFSKDLCSWLGDLHTYANDVNNYLSDKETRGANFLKLKDYLISYGYIDFNTFNEDLFTATHFSYEDLLADIDAMNIIKLFYEGTDNSLSDAMLAYYTVVQPDSALKGNRFDAFISSCTMDLNGGAGYTDLKDKFMNEVGHPLNLEYIDGAFAYRDYYDENSPCLKLMNKDTINNCLAEIYCARLFSSFIVKNSHRFD